jgi:hypothetical protein
MRNGPQDFRLSIRRHRMAMDSVPRFQRSTRSRGRRPRSRPTLDL